MPQTQSSGMAALVVAVSLAVIASLAPRDDAAVSFTSVVDTTTIAPGHGAFVGLGSPALSGNNMAFIGGYGSSGIYTAGVGVTGVVKIVENGDIAPPGPGTFSSLGTTPSVSGGNVALSGGTAGGFGIYTGTVGASGASKIVDTTTLAPGHSAFFVGFRNPSVSGSNVAFYGQYQGAGNPSGIYTGIVGAAGAARVVDTGDTATGHGVFVDFSRPAISASHLAFGGSYSGGSGIYTGTVGATGATKLVDTITTAPGHGPFTGFGDPANSGSNIAFAASYTGGNGIYTGTDGATGAAKVVDTTDTAPGHGAFSGFGNPSVNGSNVAFVGSYSGGSGLYIDVGGAGGTLTPLLNTGDALFGSTVSNMTLGSFGYDNNTLAFAYTLANGRSGIATSAVPEPASLALLLVGAAITLRRRRDRFPVN